MRKPITGFIALVAISTALIAGQLGVASAQATTVNVNPSTPTGTNNFPFGMGILWPPQLGFVYKNVPAFNLQTGDKIAFDLGATNDVDIQLQISMAQTTVNGGDVPGPYTAVASNAQLPQNPRGNNVTADYELTWTAEAPFSFPGGGLIIRFSNPSSAFAADSTGGNLEKDLATSADPSGLFVERWYNDADGQPPYTVVDGTSIAGFRLTLADSPAAPPATPPARHKKKCKKHKKRAASVAKKKCKKKRR
jgi:hypothetical protein